MELIRSTNLNQTVTFLCTRIEGLLTQKASSPQQRILIALAGVPGSGKSTVSAALTQTLSSSGIEHVMVVPMDGFHYPKAVLSTFDDPDLAFRKRGAPFTFDVNAFLKLIKCLKTTPVTFPGERELFIPSPSFDHAKQDPVPNDINISSKNKVIIIEGNYTLLNETPWDTIAEIVDERWFIDAPVEVAKKRLVDRHIKAGIETSTTSAARRAEDNDVPNGDLIRSRLIQPNVTILT